MQKIKNCFNDLSFSVVLHQVFKKKKNIRGAMSSPNSLRRDIFLGQSSVLENNNLSISFILFVCQMERVKKTKTKQKKKRK